MEGPSIRRLYYSSKEISGVVGVSAEELRLWERRFPLLRPSKSKTGRRLYRATDLELIQRIHNLLQTAMNDDAINEALRDPDARTAPVEHPASVQNILLDIRKDLKALLNLLDETEPSPYNEEEKFLFGHAAPPEQD